MEVTATDSDGASVAETFTLTTEAAPIAATIDFNPIARVGEILVNTATENDQRAPRMATLSNGGFVITWFDASGGIGGATGDTQNLAVKAQVFDVAGNPVGGEILVNTATVGGQSGQQITTLDDGSFVVAWQDGSAGVGGATGDTTGTAVKAQVFGPGFEAIEQEAFDLTGRILVDDEDSTTDDILVMLSVDYGVINIDAGTSGAAVSNNGTDSVSLLGTLAEIQALLEDQDAGDVSFTADTYTPPESATLSVLVNAGTDITTGSIEIPITAVADI